MCVFNPRAQSLGRSRRVAAVCPSARLSAAAAASQGGGFGGAHEVRPLTHSSLRDVDQNVAILVSLDFARASSLTYAMISTSFVSTCWTQHGTTDDSVAATLLSFS
jgi:hypothetical protein